MLPSNRLRYIGFSHVEADECGSLNEWLAVAPDSVPLCSTVASMTSVEDMADRCPLTLANDEVLSLGSHRVRWHDTPHLPHGWDCGLMIEETTQTLFCGDLFTQGGTDLPALTEDDILAPSEAFLLKMDYFSHGGNTGELLEHLALTQPKILACMHGSAWRGNGARLLRALAAELARE